VTELPVVDEVDAGFLLAADDIAHGVLEFPVEGGLVELLAKGTLLTEFEQLRRARQAPHVRRFDPIGHFFLPSLHKGFIRCVSRGNARPVAVSGKLSKMAWPASPVPASAARGGQPPTNGDQDGVRRTGLANTI
jgi:hypothetical protein